MLRVWHGGTNETPNGGLDDERDRNQVFGNYEGPDDRYTFGIRTFPVENKAGAEAYAERLRAEGEGRKVGR
jgi:hypothetical protein